MMHSRVLNSSVLSLAALLIAALLVKTLTGAAHARDIGASLTVVQSIDQTVYRPNCPQVEYDRRCLFAACAPDCERR